MTIYTTMLMAMSLMELPWLSAASIMSSPQKLWFLQSTCKEQLSRVRMCNLMISLFFWRDWKWAEFALWTLISEATSSQGCSAHHVLTRSNWNCWWNSNSSKALGYKSQIIQLIISHIQTKTCCFQCLRSQWFPT